MVFQTLELTTALRPELFPDETLLFVQDAVGIYEGRQKLPDYQNGHVYLTSHRICYVDNEQPRRNNTAISLKDIDRFDYTARFLKSSPKVTLHPKTPKRASLRAISAPLYAAPSPHLPPGRPISSSLRSETQSPGPRSTSNTPRPQQTTWICPICSFPNLLPPGFDATIANDLTPLPPCQTCGIKPPLAHLLKAAIGNAASRSIPPVSSVPLPVHVKTETANFSFLPVPSHEIVANTSICERCTFSNHPSLFSCEICGAPLGPSQQELSAVTHAVREDSPVPPQSELQDPGPDRIEFVKFSFRSGGDKVFYERLKGAMVQRKWLSDQAPPVPLPSDQKSGTSTPSRSQAATPSVKGVGIAGLERLGLDRRKNNETVISNAFGDLEALMASAQEIIGIAESFTDKSSDQSASKIISDAALSMATTRDQLNSSSSSETLYLKELSRTLAEYLTDDKKGVLRSEGGIMSLADLWAAFNRVRNGVELVSPSDFERAARFWEDLNLPIRLRQFRSGLLVVQRHDWSDEKTIELLSSWLHELHAIEHIEQVTWDQELFGRGVTAQEAAIKFGWSIGVATEELEMGVERGTLCQEHGVEGTKFWENWISQEPS